MYEKELKEMEVQPKEEYPFLLVSDGWVLVKNGQTLCFLCWEEGFRANMIQKYNGRCSYTKKLKWR